MRFRPVVEYWGPVAASGSRCFCNTSHDYQPVSHDSSNGTLIKLPRNASLL